MRGTFAQDFGVAISLVALVFFGAWLTWAAWLQRGGRAFEFIFRFSALPFLSEEHNRFGLGLNGLIMMILGCAFLIVWLKGGF